MVNSHAGKSFFRFYEQQSSAKLRTYDHQDTLVPVQIQSSLAWLSCSGTFRLFGHDSLAFTDGLRSISVEVVTEPHVELHDNALQCVRVVLVVLLSHLKYRLIINVLIKVDFKWFSKARRE